MTDSLTNGLNNICIRKYDTISDIMTTHIVSSFRDILEMSSNTSPPPLKGAVISPVSILLIKLVVCLSTLLFHG